MSKEKLIVFDTTLRDGEQVSGTKFIYHCQLVISWFAGVYNINSSSLLTKKPI
jgi:hypothetical protein